MRYEQCERVIPEDQAKNQRSTTKAVPPSAGIAPRRACATLLRRLDLIVVHRHRLARQGSARQVGGGIHRDTRVSNDIPGEDRAGAERGSATDLPEHVARVSTVPHQHRRVGGGSERAGDLKNPDPLVALAMPVEDELTRQLRRRRETVDAWREGFAAQILTGQGTGAGLASKNSIRALGIGLRLVSGR